MKKSDPAGIRTPVTAVKGRCPRPLDDGASLPKERRREIYLRERNPVKWTAAREQLVSAGNSAYSSTKKRKVKVKTNVPVRNGSLSYHVASSAGLVSPAGFACSAFRLMASYTSRR